MRFLLSAFCDGEASATQSAVVREHLRACVRCQATVRAYRSVPATVAALSPLPIAVAAGGAKGGGLAGAAKGGGLGNLVMKMAGAKQLVAICAVAGTTACVAMGVVPVPEQPLERPVEPRIERSGELAPSPAPAAHGEKRRNRSGATAGAAAVDPAAVQSEESEPVEAAPPPVEAAPTPPPSEPIEAAPAPTPEAEPAPAPAPAPEAGSAAGEFGP